MIIDDDTLVDHEPDPPGQMAVWPNAGGHNNQVGGDRTIVGEHNSGDAFVAKQLFRACVVQHGDAEFRNVGLENFSGPPIELPRH